MLLQMQRLEPKEWLGANAGEGRVKPETVVDVGPKARPKRRNRGGITRTLGEFHALLAGTPGANFQNSATMRSDLLMRFYLQ
jgi:hypothetical protein